MEEHSRILDFDVMLINANVLMLEVKFTTYIYMYINSNNNLQGDVCI